MKPKLADVQDADVAKAVVRALNARRAEQAAALSGRLMQRSKARADAALALVQRQMREAAERRAAAMKEVGPSPVSRLREASPRSPREPPVLSLRCGRSGPACAGCVLCFALGTQPCGLPGH